MYNPFASFEDNDTVTVETVKKAIDDKEAVTVLDVRELAEYQSGHIAGSRLLPLSELPESLSKIPDKSRKMYIYCRSGARSARAANFLRHMGYPNVHNMIGGILSWRAKGYALES